MSNSDQIGPSAVPADDSKLEGIGGWLILLAISQVAGLILFPLSIISNFSSLPRETASLQPLAWTGSFIIEGSFLLLLIYTAFLFFSKSRQFPATFIVSCVAGLLQPLVLGLWLAVTTGANMFAYVTGAETGSYLSSLAGCVIWIAYVIRSVRVRNTFVH